MTNLPTYKNKLSLFYICSGTMWRQHNSWYFNAHQLIKPWEHELKMILRQMLVTPLKEEKKQSKAKQYLVKLESYFPREKKWFRHYTLHSMPVQFEITLYFRPSCTPLSSIPINSLFFLSPLESLSGL